MKQKKSFTMYNDYWQWLKLLSDDEIGKLIRAIYTYENEHILPDFPDKKIEIPFFMIKENLDSDRKKYESICERNRANALTRWKIQQGN